ncbi:hypothetical protein [Halolamina salifodinae]|uniref:Uncharacterized protein n=1 Tax=Halolamina salifodinae TaxID=1202767 RepID=A0A8T4GST7_9EURY|nr:hypothetical protein [Halolamina salifodinae]MBP1985939.1 hypothetical protein [Halolamina salifodinae]
MIDNRDRRELVRPAVDELTLAQEEMFEELEDGFDTRADLLLWMHKASARTLGRVDDDWAVRVLRSRQQTAALVGEAGGASGEIEDLEALERRLQRDDELLEACSVSMRIMAQSSTQYADESGGSEEFGEQRWLAMRPALDELVQRQRTALEKVLGRHPEQPRGLRDHDDLSTWVRSVLQASRGIDGGLSHDAIWSRWWRMLTIDGDARVEDASLHLELADSVLSVFNAALREEASMAEESVDEVKSGQRTFET